MLCALKFCVIIALLACLSLPPLVSDPGKAAVRILISTRRTWSNFSAAAIFGETLAKLYTFRSGHFVALSQADTHELLLKNQELY